MADKITTPRSFDLEALVADPAIIHQLIIKLDGVVQKKVISFDVSKGELLRVKLNEHGKPSLNEQGTAFITERVSGKVHIKRKKKAGGPGG